MTYLLLGYGAAVVMLGGFLAGSLVKLRRSR
jgi:hypothetical protein